MCRLPWSRHHSALALSWRLTKALHPPGSYWGVGIWSGMRRTYPPPLSAFLSFNRVVSKRKSSTQGRERKGVKSSGSPFQISVFPGLCSSRKNILVGPQSPPCTLMPALCLMTDQLGACGTGERGILFLVSHCRLALFSPSVHPGNRNGGRGVGGPCRPWMIQPKGAALRLGLLGHYPQSRGLHRPHRPGPFRSPWH